MYASLVKCSWCSYSCIYEDVLTLLTECSHPSWSASTVTIQCVAHSTILTMTLPTAVQSKESERTSCCEVETRKL